MFARFRDDWCKGLLYAGSTFGKEIARSVSAGAEQRKVILHSDKGNNDVIDLNICRPGRFLKILSRARCGNAAGCKNVQLFDNGIAAVVHAVVVGDRDNVKPGIHQHIKHFGPTAIEMRTTLSLVVEITGRGHGTLQIGQGDVRAF